MVLNSRRRKPVDNEGLSFWAFLLLVFLVATFGACGAGLALMGIYNF